MSKDTSTRPPRGMRDFLPQQMRRRQYAIDVIRRVYESYGFEPLKTPALETLDVLMGKYGQEGDQLLFKVLRRGNALAKALDSKGAQATPLDLADLGLRYDLTVPLARVVAEYRGTLPAVLKRYQIQPVWRADRPARGRFREFYQCDVDVVGSTSPTVEAEILAAACQALTELGFGGFTLRLNHRQVLFGLMDKAGIPEAKHIDTVTAIDKLDKIGLEGVEKELLERGVGKQAVASLMPLLDLGHDDPRKVFKRLREKCENIEKAVQAVENLSTIVELLSAGPAAGVVKIDPYLARGLAYYTGPIFEVASDQLGVSLAGGGRYDELIGQFIGTPVPASGISLGLERLIVLMDELDLFPSELAGPHFVVTCWNAELVTESIAVAHELRAAGFRVDVFPESGKLKKQLKYAQKRSVRGAVILGPDEAAHGQVALKNFATGEQVTVRRSELSETARKILGT